MKKLITCCLIFMLVGCSANSTSTQTSLEEIKAKGEMIVGYTNYPPLGFKDESGQEVGLDIELAQKVAEKIGVDVKFQYIDWDNKLFELNNKNIDMIWNGFTVTEERAEQVNFGKPYMDNQIIVLSRADKPINTLNELAGLNVGVETQSSGQIALEKAAIYPEINEMQKYTNVADALLALNSQTVDAIVVDITFAGYTQNLNPGKYVVSKEKFESEYYAIGFRKEDDNSLRDAVDKAIDDLIKEGEAKEISEKWLGSNLIVRP